MPRKKPASPIRTIDTCYDIQDYLRYKSERDYILFTLGISTGYRAGDIVKLKIRDIKEALEDGYFTIMEGKKINSPNIRKENIKPRVVAIVPKLRKNLKVYIKDKLNYEYAFKSRKGINQHITVAHVSRILKEAGEEFGLKNISAHSMRKTYAYRIYTKNNHDIVAVKEMLGHCSIEITKKYLGLDRELFDKYSKTLDDLIR